MNYIFYGNDNPIKKISDISIQLVRTCLVLNWNQENKNSLFKKIHDSFMKVKINGLIRNFLTINFKK